MVISIVSILEVTAATNPYKQAGPYGTNCTWYAWKMAYEKAGVVLPGWGNAKNWYRDAQNSGYTVGTTPQANSIIVWGDWTSYGHVGYVESVEGNILHVWDSTGPCIDEEDPEYIECMANGVSEESDRACKANAKRIACEYTISPSQYTITGYVYLDYAPKKAATSENDSDTSKKEETTTKVTKSSNAYLSNITFSSGEITFDKEILEYNLEVENEIEAITVTATAEDQKATVSGAREYELNVGLNEIKIKVTAEDSTTKEYTIQITRKEKVEEKIEVDTENNQPEETITKNDNKKTWILLISIGFIILVGLSLMFIIRKYRNKK